MRFFAFGLDLIDLRFFQVDYLTFQTSDSTINIDQFGHVIELYDFPAEYKTTDLVNGFKAFTSRSSSFFTSVGKPKFMNAAKPDPRFERH